MIKTNLKIDSVLYPIQIEEVKHRGHTPYYRFTVNLTKDVKSKICTYIKGNTPLEIVLLELKEFVKADLIINNKLKKSKTKNCSSNI